MEIEVDKTHEGLQQYYITKIEEAQVGLFFNFKYLRIKYDYTTRGNIQNNRNLFLSIIDVSNGKDFSEFAFNVLWKYLIYKTLVIEILWIFDWE